MIRKRKPLWLIVFVLALFFAHAPAAGAAITALQGNEAVVYLRYDVEIDVQPDGTFHVREEQEVSFNEPFRTAFAEIPLQYVGQIRNIQISELEDAYTQVSGAPASPGSYGVSYEQETVFVEWMYTETTPGERRTFTLEYDVIGGLWIYEDGDILEWRAVPAERSGVPVRSSTITVNLPPEIGAEALQPHAFGPDFRVTLDDAGAIFTAEGEIQDGTAFHIMVGFPHGVVAQPVQAWQRAEDSAELEYTVRSVEVALDITNGGAVEVVERQTLAVDAGVLYGGERIIPLVYVDGLTDFSVYEGDQPFAMLGQFDPDCEACAWVQERRPMDPWIMVNRGIGSVIIEEEAAGHVLVGWTAAPLVRGEATTFILHYTAAGALQVNDEAQRLSWTAVSGFDVPVQDARALVELPDDVRAAAVEVEGGQAQTLEDGRLLITHDGALAPGESWQLRLSLPPNATTAGKPIWQQEMEAVVAEAEAIQEAFRQQEIRHARQQLGFGVGGAILLVAGLLLVGFIWYQWGRDSEAYIAPSYLTEPPSDLPPGIVAYLLDEKPTPKGVLASLFHLATLGLLRVEMSDPLQVARNWDGELVGGQEIELEDGSTAVIPGHMARLFNGLRPHLGTALTPLPEVSRHLPEIIPQVYLELGEEATRFFAQLPEHARRRWLVYGQWIVLGGVGLSLAAALFYVSQIGWIAIAPAVALVLVGAALIIVSRWMPQRSDAGAEEAAHWRAFERYLRQLQTYGDQDAAQRILDQYFAYAMALDVEDVVLQQAARMDAYMPTWTRPVIIYRPPHAPAPTTSTSGYPGPLRRRPAPRADRPEIGTRGPARVETSAERSLTLEGVAGTLAANLERANNSLTYTLQQAVGDVTETPFQLMWRGAAGMSKAAARTSLEVMEAILDEAASGGGDTSYRGSSGSRSHRSSYSSWGSSRRSSSSGRSSGSRRSGGGGRRGFGR